MPPHTQDASIQMSYFTVPIWALPLSLRHYDSSISCMAACFPTAAPLLVCLDNDVESPSEMMHARLEAEGERSACLLLLTLLRQFQCIYLPGGNMPYTQQLFNHSPWHTRWYNLQYDKAGTLPGTSEILGLWEICKLKLKVPFSYWNKDLPVHLFVFYCHCLWASTLCLFQVEPKQQ